MSSLSSFDQMLTFASSRIAQMSNEFEKHHDKLPPSELKTMTDQLKKTHKSLTQAMHGKEIPDFDQGLLKSIISYINDIKKNTSAHKVKGTKASQQVFLKALTDFQTLLKDIQKKKKTGSDLASKVKKPVVKIGAIKRQGGSNKVLDKHLTKAESKLATLKVVAEDKGTINKKQLQEVAAVLKEVNEALKEDTQTKTMTGTYIPDYNRKTMKKILEEINFLHTRIPSQVAAGTAHMQSNLFWYALREFQTLVQNLEALKAQRGKTVARVETDMSR